VAVEGDGSSVVALGVLGSAWGVHALVDGQVDGPGDARCEGEDDDLSARAGRGEGVVAAFETECVDVGAVGLGDPSPVEGEE
jgi:hypothetical protein